MNLTRWEPFYAMDKMFNRLPGFLGYGPRLGTAEYPDFDWSPAVDISETDKEYLIRAALPAVKKEDVKVTYEDGVLTPSGERRQEEQQKDEKFHKGESSYGNFLRSFALPDVIDEGDQGGVEGWRVDHSRCEVRIGGEETHDDQ